MTFQRLLIPVANDEQTSAQGAIRSGFLLAKKLGAKAIVTHVQKGAYVGVPDEGKVRTAGLQRLEPWAKMGQALNVPIQLSLVEGPDTAETICAVARDEHADLIFMPTHAREGLNRLFLGSVAERVLRLSMIPVMLMRLGLNAEDWRFEHIIVPVDGSDSNATAVKRACELARALGSRVTLLHVIDDPLPHVTAFDVAWLGTGPEEVQRLLERSASEVLNKARAAAQPLEVESQIVHSSNRSVAETIQAEVGRLEGDLLVMGTHGLRGMPRLLLGSVAEAVVHHARVPVMLVSPLQRAELWEPSVLGKLAQEITLERQRKARRDSPAPMPSTEL
jgi:nucleotide-binding universal stress UspA family protein